MSHYQCAACHQQFSKVEQALVHVNSHGFHSRRCVVPGCGRTEPKSLYKHTSTSHSSLCEYHCSSCTRVFVRQSHLSQHAPNCRGPDSKKRRSSKRTSKTKHLLYPYQCSSCIKSLGSQHGLTQHTKDKHGGISLTHNYVSSIQSNFYLGETSSTVTSSSMDRLIKKYQQELTIQKQNTKSFDLKSQTDANSLNKFIDDELQPDQSFKSLMDTTVDHICSFFRNVMSPKEIVKGGSMGKGTAVKGKSDIDLVLILNTVSDARELREKLPDLKEDIERHLENSQSRQFVVKDHSIKTTAFSVQFTVLAGNKEIDIDLLPTFYFADKQALYRQMREGASRLEAFYSAAVVKMQVDFVSCIPANVKNLIRLVKYWRKEYVVDTSKAQRLPTSYVLELITIHLWESKGSPPHFDTVKAFHSVMKALANVQSLSVIWEKNYKRLDIPENVRGKSPLVMDPANPFNNVCSRFDWEYIEQKAEEALRGQMLRNISSARWN